MYRNARRLFAALFEYTRQLLLQMRRAILRATGRRAYMQTKRQYQTMGRIHQQILSAKYVCRWTSNEFGASRSNERSCIGLRR